MICSGGTPRRAAVASPATVGDLGTDVGVVQDDAGEVAAAGGVERDPLQVPAARPRARGTAPR